MSTIDDCKLYELTKYHHKEGNITYVYPFVHVPFEIKRVFYSYDIPSGKHRGAHAHKSCQQMIVAASGSFDILLDDGTNQKRVQLNRPFLGLHIPPGIWAQEENFSSGAICLVLASENFNQDDYIREYEEYLEYIKE